MKPRFLTATGPVLLAAVALAASVPDVSAQVNPQVTQQMRVTAAKLSSLQWREVETGQGPCKITQAQSTSKRVWVVKLSCAQPGEPTAGFQLPPLKSTMTLPGARITATVQVTAVAGKAVLGAFAYVPGGGDSPPGKALEVSSPGTYAITTDPFDVKANLEYQADVRLKFDHRCTAACAVEAKFTELKWEF